ncbi:MAG: YihY/virulence factor BrkB family protein [Proteobacteria bacterium]|nr:YihY/virulence factor BrkB family protein [Pseudomonadota bacterium]MBS0573249.1 YihY/virulence factor BrkB family protein [Pseudomonadota bacterium]
MHNDETSSRNRPLPLWPLTRAIWDAIYARNASLIAAGVAFYSMFAIFPGMAATIAIWGIFADPAVVETYLAGIRGLIPDAAYSLISTQLHTLVAAHSSGWHWATLLPLAVALYSVYSAVSALMSGLNAVEERPHHSGLMRPLSSLAMTLALLGVILMALAMVVMVPIALSLVRLGRSEALVLRFVPWTILFLVVKLTLGLFYRFAGSGEDGRHGWISAGSVVAALLWAMVSFAFSLYLENFNSYNRVYGSIGAVIALMMWLYLSAYIVLIGAILNAEILRLRQAAQ